ncbi:hypothetical protein [Aquimarina algiphila]|uniref:hypothetical protein n=1 Tax=Aquimarina algiphila TaxID=2047982 RepID=UPI00232E6346|nr:hypothetical protein [Aquimarina algiphila]
MNPFLAVGILGILLTISGLIIYDLNGGTSENNNTKLQGYSTLTIMIGLAALSFGLLKYIG